MREPTLLAFLQLDTREDDPDGTRQKVEAAIAEARSEGATLVALPELWASGYDLPQAVQQADWDADFHRMKELSVTHDLGILAGSLLELAPEKDTGGEAAGGPRHYNTATAYEGGHERNRYRKAHLFGLLGEPKHLLPGERPPRIFLSGEHRLKVAQAICYDLRFPELFRPLAFDGVELIVICAQWPRRRIAHWDALLRARAIENQCYVVGVNRCGRLNDIEFGANSAAYSPTGELIAEAGTVEGLCFAKIDPEEVTSVRKLYPFLKDRREFPDEATP